MPSRIRRISEMPGEKVLLKSGSKKRFDRKLDRGFDKKLNKNCKRKLDKRKLGKRKLGKRKGDRV